MEINQKILIVDDRPESLFALEKILEETGAQIIQASSGNEALVACLHHDFALAVLDVQMPEMDGYELAELMRSSGRTRSVPIIFLSAVYSDDFHVFKGYESGAVDFITKPYNPKLMASKVKVFLDLDRNRHELEAQLAERKQKEESLGRSEARLRLALEAARMAAWEYDPATGKVSLSRKADEVLALSPCQSPDDIDQWYSLIHPDDVENHRALVTEAIRSAGSYVSVYRQVRDGEPVWLEERGQAITDEPGRTVRLVGVAQNITARKQAEDELRKAYHKLYTNLESITDGFLAIDRDWRYTYFNETGARILGMNREELIGGLVWELFPHAVESRFYTEYHRAVESNTPVHFEEFYPEPLNLWLECHCYPSEEGLSVFFRDVTERRKGEEALRESEERYRALFENMTEGFALGEPILDEAGNPYDIRFIEINDAFEKQSGLSREILGKPMIEVLPPARGILGRNLLRSCTERKSGKVRELQQRPGQTLPRL